MTPTREADRLLRRIRALVHDSRRTTTSRLEREACSREIERLKSELAAVVKETVAAEREQV